MHQGRDAWPEDTRWVYDGAIKRGIHCLAFHGPGQGLALRLNDLPFRYDWEKAVTPAVDFALAQPGVDPERVVLMGLSFGGYLAPRAAAFEKRIKICIADPGVLDWGASAFEHLPPPLVDAFAAGPEPFNALVATLFADQPLPTWYIRDQMWKHAASSPHEMFQRVVECSLVGLAQQIEAEMLVMDGTSEVFSDGQSQQLFDALTCTKTLMLFDAESTAQLHCQNGGNATAGERLFDWLDERLA
jgi:pimeloyl-ACP methyl ester carboxylesterase